MAQGLAERAPHRFPERVRETDQHEVVFMRRNEAAHGRCVSQAFEREEGDAQSDASLCGYLRRLRLIRPAVRTGWRDRRAMEDCGQV